MASVEESSNELTTESDTLRGAVGIEIVGRERHLLRKKIKECIRRQWVRKFLYLITRSLQTYKYGTVSSFAIPFQS